MKKTFIAAMMLACVSLSASANTVQGPTDPEFEATVWQLVCEGVYTEDEALEMIDAYYNGNVGIATCSMANPKKGKNKGGGGNIIEDEVPLSLTPVVGTTGNKKNNKKKK